MAALPEVFRSAEARTGGMTTRTLRSGVAAGELRRIRRGVYAEEPPPPPPEALAVSAVLARLSHPAAAGHASAARLHGLPLPPGWPAGPTLLSDHKDACCVRRYVDARIRRAALPAGDLTVVAGVPVTTLERTALDLARTLPRPAGVAVADAALRAGAGRAALAAGAEACAHWPGIRKARAVIGFADPRAESPIESYARELCWALGLPIPEPQVWLGGEDGLVGRVDLLWRAHRTVGEATASASTSAARAARARSSWPNGCARSACSTPAFRWSG